ncbi:MAG: oxidoreductase [Rhodobiaceae bacterium]|nr:oxidoreductase [Rhodobiaceae bacterium]
MMMSLGLFIFSIETAAYQQLQRSTAVDWAANKRIGQRAASQFIGPGDDTITLSGVLLPAFTGGASNLDQLRAMMNRGKASTLMDGRGHVLGFWSIRSVQETHSVFYRDGTARRIEFDMTLHHEADDIAELAELSISDIPLSGRPAGFA